MQQFTNQQLKELIDQIDILVQLLYQILIMPKQEKKDDHQEILQTSNNQQRYGAQEKQDNDGIKDAEKYEVYSLLYDLINNRDEAIRQF